MWTDFLGKIILCCYYPLCVTFFRKSKSKVRQQKYLNVEWKSPVNIKNHAETQNDKKVLQALQWSQLLILYMYKKVGLPVPSHYRQDCFLYTQWVCFLYENNTNDKYTSSKARQDQPLCPLALCSLPLGASDPYSRCLAVSWGAGPLCSALTLEII